MALLLGIHGMIKIFALVDQTHEFGQNILRTYDTEVKLAFHRRESHCHSHSKIRLHYGSGEKSQN